MDLFKVKGSSCHSLYLKVKFYTQLLKGTLAKALRLGLPSSCFIY